jgi:predicted anti-sigma-YlaC factor YlaD
MADCEQYKSLLAGLLDGELTAEEAADVNDHLIRCASCRADYEQLRKAENKLEAISFAEVTDEEARAFWRLPYSRTLRNASLFMIIGGYAALILYGVVMWMIEGSEGLFQRLAVTAIVIGFVVLLGLMIVERINTYKVDPYKEIER